MVKKKIQNGNSNLPPDEGKLEMSEAEEENKQSEMRVRALINAIPDTFFRCSINGIIIDAETKYGNFAPSGSARLHQDNNLIGKTVNDLFSPDIAKKISVAIEKAYKTGDLQIVKYSSVINDYDCAFEARMIKSGVEEVILLIRDISDHIEYEKKLNYLCFHDQLTGLNNRAYFEHELKRLDGSREYPISIIAIDLDGVKLVNDALGHATGDALLKAAADVLKQSLRHSDVLTRTGGDEFVALLPRTGIEIAREIVQRMHNQADLHSRKNSYLPLSFSIGIATASDAAFSLSKALVEADELLVENKQKKGSAIKAYIVDAMIKALGEKDFNDQGHSYRMEVLSQSTGSILGLKAKQLARLKLLISVHDLGKVGIADDILFKKEKLTEDEWRLLHQHPEKGFRIASNSPQISGVADLILRHHECWDGSGYPLGLSGEEIPIECRIMLAIDAFDVMTSERPYSEVISVDQALDELKLYAGSKFDPKVIEALLKAVKESGK